MTASNPNAADAAALAFAQVEAQFEAGIAALRHVIASPAADDLVFGYPSTRLSIALAKPGADPKVYAAGPAYASPADAVKRRLGEDVYFENGNGERAEIVRRGDLAEGALADNLASLEMLRANAPRAAA